MGIEAAKPAGFWESTAAGIAALQAKLQCLMRHCAELNLGTEHRLLEEQHRALAEWRVRIAILGGRHTGKTTLLNFLLGRHVFETGAWPVSLPVVRVRAGPRARIELRLAGGYRETIRWTSHRDFLDKCAAAPEGSLEHVTDCTFYFPDEPVLRHAELIELSAPADVLQRCDLVLLTVSASAPLFDDALTVVQGFRRILTVVTNAGGLAVEDCERIRGHVRSTLEPYRVPVFALDDREALRAGIVTAIERDVTAPLVAGMAAEIARVAGMAQAAATFTESAMRTDAAAYARAHETARSDLQGLNRAIVDFEEALARGDSKIQAALPALTGGLLDEMEKTAAERIDAPEAGANPESILAEANEKAVAGLRAPVDYAVREFRHNVTRVVSELFHIRSSAEIRVQEIVENFLTAELAGSLLEPELLQAAAAPTDTDMPEWLAAQINQWLQKLAAKPAYTPPALASIRQIMLAGLKNCLARHWEIAGAPAESLTAILHAASRQFLRAPAERWLAEMRRNSQALQSAIHSRRLDLLAAPADPETRAVLAKVNSCRRAECAAIQSELNRFTSGEQHGYTSHAQS